EYAGYKGYLSGNAIMHLSMSLLANGSFDLCYNWGCTFAGELLGTHVEHVHYVNNAASVRLILTFLFLLISPTGSTGSERDKYESIDKEPFYNLVHKHCYYFFAKLRYSDNYKATGIAVNGETAINGRMQRVENSIIGCTTVYYLTIA
ncbi:MAG: hypothetical protein MPJ22_13165, partial [Pirellulales bacterium]|nr:hypothetical protein [Pirellulales bacterium]